MKKQAIYIVIILAVAILLTFGLSFLNDDSTPSGPGQYDELAVCLADKGVKFYGAFWCSHCAEQKKIFGNSAKLLPYIECSTPNAMDQTDVCKAAGIESYPTWIFPDGSKVTGGLTPAELATKSECALANASSTPSSIDKNTSVATSTKK